MTNATKPGLELTDPQAYQKKMFDLLGTKNPIEVLSSTPRALSQIVKNHPVKALRARPFPGKWTPTEIIGHLVDTEWTYGFRLRHILAEENPVIIGMQQEQWVMAQRYNERDPEELVSAFSELRKQNVPVWKSLGPAELRRTGQHNERGEESLDIMLRMSAGHDLNHLQQIGRYLEAIR